MNEYISREALKKAIDTWDRFYYVPLQGVKRGCNDDYTALVRIDDILHCIDNMPSADVQPVKRGEWDFRGYQLFKCTSCKEIFTQNQLEAMVNHTDDEFVFPNFCPNCGARMDLKDGETK